MLENLLNLDQNITLALNGSNSLYADAIMMLITSTVTWIPVGVVMLYIIVKNNELPHLLSIFVLLVFCVLVSNGLSEICKALFERWRPSVDPHIMYMVKVVNGYRESKYGFFSAHAANTMSIAMFLSLLFKKPRATFLFLLWSLLNGWSRVYLGVHYIGDVLVGWVIGAVVGCLLYFAYHRISWRFAKPARVISSEYTRSGYLAADIDFLSLALLLTFAAIAVIACVYPV